MKRSPRPPSHRWGPGSRAKLGSPPAQMGYQSAPSRLVRFVNSRRSAGNKKNTPCGRPCPVRTSRSWQVFSIFSSQLSNNGWGPADASSTNAPSVRGGLPRPRRKIGRSIIPPPIDRSRGRLCGYPQANRALGFKIRRGAPKVLSAPGFQARDPADRKS
jgi:hypothetical protein